MMDVPVSVPPHLPTLGRVLASAVPALEGTEDHTTFVRLVGTFTPAEVTQLQTLVAAHDGNLARADVATRLAMKQTRKALTPGSLSVVARLERIELLLDLD